MKRIFLTLWVLCLAYSLGSAQNFVDGLEFYKEEDFESALEIFNSTNDPLALLYSGKSYYALGNLNKAEDKLNECIIYSKDKNMEFEAKYTLSVVSFHKKKFTNALQNLYDIISDADSTLITINAEIFYKDILNYLSENQVYDALKSINNIDIKTDLVATTIGRFDYDTVIDLLAKLKRETNLSRDNYMVLEQRVGSKTDYERHYPVLNKSKAPNGTVYRLGVSLPYFDFDSNEYEISQHLYFGIYMAVEHFNSLNNGKKIFIDFQTSEDEARSAQNVFKIMDENNTDVIIGPLFSQASSIYAKLSDDFKIPTIAPLANSENLTQNTKHLFQVNTPLKIQGKKLAQYAIEMSENPDTLIVLTESNTSGEVAALAFMEEYENLGGIIKHTLIRDFSKQSYVLFINDPQIQEDLKENSYNIFASFTGAASSSLTKALLTELEASKHNFSLFGTEEWSAVNLLEYQLRGTQLYYTQSITHLAKNSANAEFARDFKQRFEISPNEFAYVGYDVARLVISILEEVENPDYLTESLRELDLFEGLNANIGFNGAQSNQKIRIFSKP